VGRTKVSLPGGWPSPEKNLIKVIPKAEHWEEGVGFVVR